VSDHFVARNDKKLRFRVSMVIWEWRLQIAPPVLPLEIAESTAVVRTHVLKPSTNCICLITEVMKFKIDFHLERI
jgi:hypothetical protein